MFKIYLAEHSINDATEYYISLIERAIAKYGKSSKRVFSLVEINPEDVIVTIETREFVFAWFQKRGNRRLNWFQGIIPEEAMMATSVSPLRKLIRKWAYTGQEFLTLCFSDFNLFVSSAMSDHYKRKYPYKSETELVVPCYNKRLNQRAFLYPAKYEKPTFVYAGSMAAWQCVDKTFQIFREIEKEQPNARLTVLSGEQAEARFLLEKYGIVNAEVKHVPLELLDEELVKYKYGFLIREKHIVNYVATPTKMNSYLAAGIIPIYTDVIQSFEENIDLGAYSLKLSSADSVRHSALCILKFEGVVVSPEELGTCYANLFRGYYNDDFYLNRLKDKLKFIE